MSIALSTYYGFTKVREQSPDANDWAVTDGNFELVSLLLKNQEQHRHNGAVGISYPGFNAGSPTNPTLPTGVITTTGGTLTAGTVVGTRLSYLNAAGLETDAGPEATFDVGVAAARPLTPVLVSKQAAAGALAGGSYIYVVTKRNGSGETLPSDILPVDVTYDQTYSVTLSFNPINSYTDGTTAINIYRSVGLNSQFQLLTSITSTSATTYIDDGTVPPANAGIQPPAISTFNAQSKVRISWAGITVPPGAAKIRVYVTQQTGIWGTFCLLLERDLTTGTPANYVDYMGSESLAAGAPKNASSIPTNPPKIDLSTEATLSGVFTLTNSIDFAGYQAQNLRLYNKSGAPTTPTNGFIYYDTSTNNVRAYINGAWVNWGTSTASSYSHPAEESGGHIAANIRYYSGGVSVKSVLDQYFTSVGGRKQNTKVYPQIGITVEPSYAGTSNAVVPDMAINGIIGDFDNQWMEITFSGSFKASAGGMNVIIMLEYDSATIESSTRTYTASAPNQSFIVNIHAPVQLGVLSGGAKLVQVLWRVDSGTVTAVGTRRSLTAKVLA